MIYQIAQDSHMSENFQKATRMVLDSVGVAVNDTALYSKAINNMGQKSRSMFI